MVNTKPKIEVANEQFAPAHLDDAFRLKSLQSHRDPLTRRADQIGKIAMGKRHADNDFLIVLCSVDAG